MVDEAKVAKFRTIFRERDDLMKESWVKAMQLRLVRDELGKCQQAEGVNHYENCRWLADMYLGMMRDHRVTGYKSIDV